MKCEVIKDLLPLYAEDLCSEESKIIVNEHISTCSDCRRYLDSITKKIEPLIPSEAEIKERMSEKDLLSKSKQSIQNNILKKILTAFNIISIAITVLAIIISVIFMFKEYSIKYPMLHYTPGISFFYLICFIIGLSPVLIALLQLFSIIKKDNTQHYIRKFIFNILLQIAALVLSLIITITIFLIVPPLESQTNKIKKYLDVDRDIVKYEAVYNSFFPAEIPKAAENLEYHYKKYSNLINTNVQIQFSMVLPEMEYLTEKDRVLENNAAPITGEENAFDITLHGVRYPGKIKLEFRFDDVSKKLIYNLYLDDN
ncbi:MAG: zf-HC2 domain-containing protein [Hungatella sp.]|jgi:heme/copper-type cytochrome/quinol oxidase subunit 2|nr:zf-HC2 domain-containing protein [Hungatella sp.]MDR2025269.1 zf-HC2 domain-containing protein [Hungatella sp.]